MGGGGSIQGMNTSLSNNKKLLRSKRLFKKEKTFLNVKKEYLKASKGKLNFKTTSKEELLELRKKILKERKKERSIFILIGLTVIGFFIYFSFNLFQQNDNVLTDSQSLELKERKKKYLLYIADGDEYFQNSEWHHSIYYYKKAKEFSPKNYDINYRLVRSYSYHCKNELKNCLEAKELLNELFLISPDKENQLLKIKSILEYEF